MKKLQLLLLVASLAAPAMAQEKFELGKPGNDAYRYLDQYKGLKEYIDHEKYPNFKLSIATENLNNSLVKNLISKNASETVAGNAMKMGSVVDGNGNMNFNNVKTFVNTATNAGVSVYGHTLAWHSQQPKGWLLKLLADKPDPNGEATYAVIDTPRPVRRSMSSRPSAVPANTQSLYIAVAAGRYHAAVDLHGLAVADEHGGEHVHWRIAQLAERHHVGLFALAPDIAHSAAYRGRVFMRQQDVASTLQVVGPLV